MRLRISGDTGYPLKLSIPAMPHMFVYGVPMLVSAGISLPLEISIFNCSAFAGIFLEFLDAGFRVADSVRAFGVTWRLGSIAGLRIRHTPIRFVFLVSRQGGLTNNRRGHSRVFLPLAFVR